MGDDPEVEGADARFAGFDAGVVVLDLGDPIGGSIVELVAGDPVKGGLVVLERDRGSSRRPRTGLQN
jgi:hypothetical protein